jgi:hypothetical protein
MPAEQKYPRPPIIEAVIEFQFHEHLPVLIDHFSLMLDLDLILDRDIPGRPEGWWERLDLVRKAKNRVFEASITDKVRELFQ